MMSQVIAEPTFEHAEGLSSCVALKGHEKRELDERIWFRGCLTLWLSSSFDSNDRDSPIQLHGLVQPHGICCG